jgi:hypothetical protein
LPLGGDEQLTIIVNWSDGRTTEVNQDITWTVTPSIGNALITSAGKITGITEGACIVHADYNGLLAHGNVTITAKELDRIVIDMATPSLGKGRTQQFSALGYYTDGSTALLTTQVNWTVIPGTGTGVIDNAGLFMATGEGSCAVKAEWSGVTSNSANIQITASELVSILVSATSATQPLGNSQSLSAIANYTDGTTTEISTTSNWILTPAGGNGQISMGQFQGTAVGDCYLTASSIGINSNSLLITVTAKELTQISLAPATLSIPMFLEQDFTVIGVYTDQSTGEITLGVNFSVTSQGVDYSAASPGVNYIGPSPVVIGSVDGDGLFTATEVGEGRLTASYGTVPDAVATITVENAQTPEILTVTPNVGVNTGVVSMDVTGTGFHQVSAGLVRSDNLDLIVGAVQPGATTTAFTVVYDLTGKTAGTIWNLAIKLGSTTVGAQYLNALEVYGTLGARVSGTVAPPDAVVEVWRSNVRINSGTAVGGSFLVNSGVNVSPETIEVRIYQRTSVDSGYYPQVEYHRVVPGQILTITPTLLAVPTLNYTDQLKSFASSPTSPQSLFNGKKLRVGDVIEAKDSTGTLCGLTILETDEIWSITVIGDDSTTTVDEGAEAGETISFFINGLPAVVVDGTPTWDAAGGVPEIIELEATE